MSLSSNHFWIKLLSKFSHWSSHNFFALSLDLVTISIKPSKTVLALLPFKGFTRAYLVKTYMTHNKYLTSQFLEEIDPILAKYAVQFLSLNVAYTLLLLKFLIIGLWNCWANNSFTFAFIRYFFPTKRIHHTY